jgi:NAD-dependent dihydropyrimidine dehydrogenase PreA subunit
MPAIVQVQLCDGCQACEWSCPAHAVTVMDRMAIVAADECTDCGTCQQVCARAAIQACPGSVAAQSPDRMRDLIFEVFAATNTRPWLGALGSIGGATMDRPAIGPAV